MGRVQAVDNQALQSDAAQGSGAFKCLDVWDQRQGEVRLWLYSSVVGYMLIVAVYWQITELLCLSVENIDTRDIVDDYRISYDGVQKWHKEHWQEAPPNLGVCFSDTLGASCPRRRAMRRTTYNDKEPDMIDPRFQHLYNTNLRLDFMQPTLTSFDYSIRAYEYRIKIAPTASYADFSIGIGVDETERDPDVCGTYCADNGHAVDGCSCGVCGSDPTGVLCDDSSCPATLVARCGSSDPTHLFCDEDATRNGVGGVQLVRCPEPIGPDMMIPTSEGVHPAALPLYNTEYSVSEQGDVKVEVRYLTKALIEAAWYRGTYQVQEAQGIYSVAAWVGAVGETPEFNIQQVDVEFVLTDQSQPKPYAPAFTGTWRFLVGFCVFPILTPLVTVTLRVFLQIWLHVRYRTNQGLPPPFYRSFRKFRGW